MVARNIILVGLNQKAVAGEFPNFGFMKKEDPSGDILEYSLPEIICDSRELPAMLANELDMHTGEVLLSLKIIHEYVDFKTGERTAYYHLNIGSHLILKWCNRKGMLFDRLPLMHLPEDFYAKFTVDQNTGVENFVESMNEKWMGGKNKYVFS